MLKNTGGNFEHFAKTRGFDAAKCRSYYDGNVVGGVDFAIEVIVAEAN